jgi:hypothetical protein
MRDRVRSGLPEAKRGFKVTIAVARYETSNIEAGYLLCDYNVALFSWLGTLSHTKQVLP